MPERELRQSDPISPYLFICVMEAFIGLIDSTARQGHIPGIQVARSAPCITNLCFADDTMVLCESILEYAS